MNTTQRRCNLQECAKIWMTFINIMLKEVSHRSVHIVRFHLYKNYKQAKCMCAVRQLLYQLSCGRSERKRSVKASGLLVNFSLLMVEIVTRVWSANTY